MHDASGPSPRRPASCRAAKHEPYRLVARKSRAEFAGNRATRPVRVGNVTVGAGRPVVIAGPCAVETRAQTLAVARAVADAGADLLRGGAFKPRTSPYDFQGRRRAGLEILAEARAETGLPIVTEVMDPRLVEEACAFADCLQIGARNMQNFPLLVEVGRAGKPVLLKRHWGATLAEWLCAAEYVANEGNLDVILCERGIRSFAIGEYSRSTLDLNVVPALARETFLPVIVDPSHATGDAELVPSACGAAMGAGAQGLLIEVLEETADPDEALCDGKQSIRPSVLAEIVRRVRESTPDTVTNGAL
jgi:3-deoxy-7-phosphoheptulonate synthase